jgi:hypothetical protein
MNSKDPDSELDPICNSIFTDPDPGGHVITSRPQSHNLALFMYHLFVAEKRCASLQYLVFLLIKC